MLACARPIARAGAAGTAWVTAASLVLVGSMIVATSPAAPSPIAIESRLESALDALRAPPRGSYAPLSAGILDVLFGEGTSQGLFGAPHPKPSPEPATYGEPTPEPEPSPSPGILPEQLTSRPDIRIEMTADRSTAGPGDTITYTISWENAGRGRAEAVQIDSHIPEHTRWVASGEGVCINPDQDPSTEDICVPAPAPVEPEPDPEGHARVAGYDSAAAGYRDSFTFTVIVDGDAPSGFVIRNHAHIQALGVTRQNSNEVAVTVQ